MKRLHHDTLERNCGCSFHEKRESFHVLLNAIFKSPLIPAHYRWARAGDVNAFFGLMLDNMSDLVVMSGILIYGFGIPHDVVIGRMIPGTAVGVLVGDLLYTWMAWRLAARTGKDDVCAMPLGLDTPSTFVFCLGIIGPLFLEGRASGLSDHDAGMTAWHAGMAVLVMTGIVKIGLSFVGTRVRSWIPRAGLLGSIAGIAIVLIAFLPALDVFASPVAGFLSLGVILIAVIPGRSLPFRLPGAFTAVTLGVIAYYILAAFGGIDGSHLDRLTNAASLHVAFPVPTLAFLEELPSALRFLPVALPWAVATVVGGIDCTESAAAAGDDYNTRNILLVEGAATVIGGLCGGVLQSTPYIGHPAYKRMGGRAGYTLATALFIGLGGILGYLGFIVELLPKAATAPILIFIGLEITAQAFTASPKHHAPAVALAFVPVVADLIIVMLGQFQLTPAELAQRAPEVYPTLLMLANGFIVTAVIWGGGAAFLADYRYRAAALTFLTGAVCTAVGIIHSPFAGGNMFLPWQVLSLAEESLASSAGGPIWQSASACMTAYVMMTVAYVLIALLAGSMRWIMEEREAPQIAE